MQPKKSLPFLLFLLASFSVYADDPTNVDNFLSNFISPTNIKTNKELYADEPNSDLYHNDLLAALGWVKDSNKTPSCLVCGGYYDQSQFPTPSTLSFSEAPTTIKANPPVSYTVNGKVVFNNGVAIRQPGRVLYATNATITPNLKTGKLEAITADNGIRIEEPGHLLLAKSFTANLIDHQAEMDEVNYLFNVNSSGSTGSPDVTPDPLFTGFAYGSADTAKQLSADKFSFTDGTYSTCSPASATWSFWASTINIDQAEGMGTAYNVVGKIHGVPLLYLPYFEFPINSQRKSGFLFGNIGTGANNGGFAFSIPYYFNLAPNFDDTLSPNIYTNRGVLLSNDFRFLTSSSSGDIGGQFMPSDNQYNYQNRYNYSINDTTNFTDHLSGNLSYNGVSDTDFFSDFSLQNLASVNQTLLNRSGSLNYQNSHWTINGLVQGYQIVNTDLSVANRPYQELPAITAVGQYPSIFGPLGFSLNTSYVYFQKSSDGFTPAPVNAQRVNIAPTITLPLNASYGYFTPTLTFDNTLYSLSNNVQNNFPGANPSLDVPIFDIDTSLYFDRAFKLGSNSYTQTLSPRLFYLYVPYRDQSNIPIFDTSINTFGFNQLFSTNSFSGLDRVQAANQISYALTTEIDNAQGVNLMSAGIGQIYYMADRSVSLCQNTPGSTTPCITSENPFYQDHLSDVAGYFNYNFNPAWSFNANVSYNPNINLLDVQNYSFQYIPNKTDIFNIGYQFNRQNYSFLSTQQILSGTAAPVSSTIDASFIYGITPTWAILGSINYSIQNSGVVNIFGGIQYSTCCWAIRVMEYGYVSNNNPNTPNVIIGPISKTFMVQLLLKGLGGTSGQGTGLLATIPGYNNQLGF